VGPADATAATITIVVADDHAVVRGGLRRLLDGEPDLQVVAEAGDVDETKARVAEHRPAILLLDLHMPGGGSLPALRSIRDASPSTGILILTMQDDPGYAREALSRGARGYVLKEAEEADLLHAVRTVAAGATYLQPELGARLLTASVAEPLTQRERDVLRLIALGHTNSEAAAQLHLSVRTVETHRANIQSKLGSASRAELVRHAMEQGLITP
jgi:two-component system response regulator NreC